MSSLTRVFLREGAAYFLAISAINIINGIFNFQYVVITPFLLHQIQRLSRPYIPMQTNAVPFGLLLPNLLVRGSPAVIVDAHGFLRLADCQ